MAKIRAGILSGIDGKVAGVVGARWKDKAYIRAYVVPAYSNTDAQVEQRNLFKATALFAVGIVGNIFNVYVDKFIRSMSGYNWFIKKNIALFATPVTYGSIQICHGNLFAAVATVAARLVDVVTVTFATGLGSNGKNTDMVFAALMNTTSGRWSFASDEVARSAGQIEVTVPTAETGTYECYILTCRRDKNDNVILVSDSSYVQSPA